MKEKTPVQRGLFFKNVWYDMGSKERPTMSLKFKFKTKDEIPADHLATARNLLVYDHLSLELLDSSSAAVFPGQLLGMNKDFTFRLANAGELGLDIQSVSLGGTDAAQFSLVLPDISAAEDLASGEFLEFTVTFSPGGSGSGPRNATVSIGSNDPETPVLSFSISGLGLSGTADEDADNMNDWAEYSLRGFGFVWDEPQPIRVSDYYTFASAAGLYSKSEAAAVEGLVELVDVDPATETAAFTIELKESDDLETFTKIVIDPAKLSADGDGKIRYEVEAPPGKKFFRAGFKP
jgi:hypothetical protein